MGAPEGLALFLEIGPRGFVRGRILDGETAQGIRGAVIANIVSSCKLAGEIFTIFYYDDDVCFFSIGCRLGCIRFLAKTYALRSSTTN